MKKTTIKISWDTLQEVKKVAQILTDERKENITQDQAIRYLVALFPICHKKVSQNGLKSKLKAKENKE